MSSPAKFAGGTVKPILSAREQEILMAAWICVKGADPQVDYDRLARVLGLKNSHTASTVFCTVKKKVKAYRGHLAGDDEEPLSPVVRASTSRKRATGDGDAPNAGRAKKARSKAPSTPDGAVGIPQGEHMPQNVVGSDDSGDV